MTTDSKYLSMEKIQMKISTNKMVFFSDETLFKV